MQYYADGMMVDVCIARYREWERKNQKEAEVVGKSYEPKRFIFRAYKEKGVQTLKKFYNLVGDEIVVNKAVSYDALPFMKK